MTMLMIVLFTGRGMPLLTSSVRFADHLVSGTVNSEGGSVRGRGRNSRSTAFSENTQR